MAMKPRVTVLTNPFSLEHSPLKHSAQDALKPWKYRRKVFVTLWPFELSVSSFSLSIARLLNVKITWRVPIHNQIIKQL